MNYEEKGDNRRLLIWNQERPDQNWWISWFWFSFKTNTLNRETSRFCWLMSLCLWTAEQADMTRSTPSWSAHRYSTTLRSPKDAPVKMQKHAATVQPLRIAAALHLLSSPPLSADALWSALERCRERGSGPEREKPADCITERTEAWWGRTHPPCWSQHPVTIGAAARRLVAPPSLPPPTDPPPPPTQTRRKSIRSSFQSLSLSRLAA